MTTTAGDTCQTGTEGVECLLFSCIIKESNKHTKPMSATKNTIDALRDLQDALNTAEAELNLDADTCIDFFSNILHDLGMSYEEFCDA